LGAKVWRLLTQQFSTYAARCAGALSFWNKVVIPDTLRIAGSSMTSLLRRATKLVISIKNLTYEDRLKRLKLPTLKYRRIGDIIEVYKILTNKYDSRMNLYIEKQQDSI